jgi:tartrate dehydratase alpha subunit/fumarate hydratase class I-like protein
LIDRSIHENYRKSLQLRRPKADDGLIITFRLDNGQEMQITLPNDLAAQMAKGLILAFDPQSLKKFAGKKKMVH